MRLVTTHKKLEYIFLLLITILLLISCERIDKQKKYVNVSQEKIYSQHTVPVYDYKILRSYPHDVSSFTEGIYLDKNDLYESSGLYSQSKWRRIKLDTGKVVAEYILASQYFAEGIAVLGNSLYQLTYESNIGFIYNKDTLKLEKTFNYPTQGWGLTTNGSQLIMSDGSSTLSFLDTQTFKVVRRITVHDQNGNIESLNALAYINGKIYANIWFAEIIAIISPLDGHVEGWIDLTGLKPVTTQQNTEAVLNGIAYDKQDDTLLVTGKNWPTLFKIKLVPHAAHTVHNTKR